MSRLPLTDAEKDLRETDNGLRQYALGLSIAEFFLHPERPFALRPGIIRQVQRAAVEGIESDAGEYRTGVARITGSDHTPPDAYLVENLVREMCDYVNDNWHEQPPFHLAAYVLWRLNWIHPFADGNGRTSRILSYIVLTTRLGYMLPGQPTIPQQIEADRSLYIKACEYSDKAWKREVVDLTAMEDMLKGMLAHQLLSVISDAGGSLPEN